MFFPCFLPYLNGQGALLDLGLRRPRRRGAQRRGLLGLLGVGGPHRGAPSIAETVKETDFRQVKRLRVGHLERGVLTGFVSFVNTRRMLSISSTLLLLLVMHNIAGTWAYSPKPLVLNNEDRCQLLPTDTLQTRLTSHSERSQRPPRLVRKSIERYLREYHLAWKSCMDFAGPRCVCFSTFAYHSFLFVSKLIDEPTSVRLARSKTQRKKLPLLPVASNSTLASCSTTSFSKAYLLKSVYGRFSDSASPFASTEPGFNRRAWRKLRVRLTKEEILQAGLQVFVQKYTILVPASFLMVSATLNHCPVSTTLRAGEDRRREREALRSL